ncbi:nitrogenase iron-molybdenum cofactor biosynthesis protein NifN (plasmid) [Sinorhizobium numidicum]|uniref:Nitrogenase iron-molybdenum cofactor biosynthesis protein NifN n=1 Tax=Sinorhizobium numidicum TaxID=680248 RepID=A0ABY8D6P4_9HYPH|nr:nitrogenase component 1 [Sinorhizobium numidicum]WEX79523.1 nitrogenase iron-molybdenum cofactor biosynthesis protein NifN [Sinorhizobium numidicum]WEX85523.1 nitrogenase iron-molybdenum cofactor biosynthesis protein NifN [Sinorhizobium numidicum]
MACMLPQAKSTAINPVKSSQPLGAAFAFLGVDGAVPLFHGSQECTSFALVLLVRHFKETIPLQTTAMEELETILGGEDRLKDAILNSKARAEPQFIAVCTTALVETGDDDTTCDLANIKLKRARELTGTEVVLANAPEALEEGWSKAVTAIVDRIARPGKQKPDPKKVGDIRDLGAATKCRGTGEHMRRPAEALQRLTAEPYVLFESLAGLKNAGRFILLLTTVSGEQAPAKVLRGRMQLQDAMLDGHFHLGGKKIAISAEPDQLLQLSDFFVGMGAKISAAATTTGTSKILQKVPAETVQVGDLCDLERLSAVAHLLVTYSHGRPAAERLAIPLMHAGFPVFDTLGSQHKLTILYQGTRDMIYEVANIMQADQHPPTPDALDPVCNRGL